MADSPVEAPKENLPSVSRFFITEPLSTLLRGLMTET